MNNLKQQIESQYIKWFGTQSNFCENMGIKPTNYSRKINPFINKFNWLNAFLKPIKGRLKIEWEDEDRDEDGNLISCCGDVLDEDIMICPTCKEHN